MDDTAERRWRPRLVEVLVAVGVLAALAALIVRGILASREAERRMGCSENLHKIAVALLNYERAHKTFPPGMICDKGEDPAFTEVLWPNWAILVLPFVGEQGLHRTYDQVSPLTAPGIQYGNYVVRATPIPEFLCPADATNNRIMLGGNAFSTSNSTWARGNYAVNAGNVFIGRDGGVVDAKSPQWQDPLRRGVMAVNDCTMGLGGITDGTSQTILAGEIRAGVTEKDRRGVWAMGMAGSSIACAHGSWGDDNGPNACNLWADDIKDADQIKLGPAAADHCMDAWGGSGSRQATYRSLHPGGCNLAMADASVHFIRDTIETSGPWGNPGPGFWPVWDLLICSADHHLLDGGKEAGRSRPARLRRSERPLTIRDLVPVRGTVKLREGAVPEGQYRFVTFHPDFFSSGIDDAVKGAGGEIKPDGRFEMTTIKPGDGVLPGRYKVTIRCLTNYADPGSLTIPKKYADLSTTPLVVTIDTARSDLVFELDK